DYYCAIGHSSGYIF
nr:immunoglobulin light chain junction region [Macaca mulatta]MOV67225.1 immunoglobulin light chain junction region [Macaca mulatta]MOV68409.1 immunoglobulin light chain junction region [Macaca mulatta]MOV69272.1 immunoglobulin light chain junction region [Macaca mulatta]MOV69834.1 immunoglobulin light chain junction region [Macaca mulatta]